MENKKCENCVFFVQDAFTEIGECTASLNQESHLKFVVYKKDSAKFCEKFSEKENQNE